MNLRQKVKMNVETALRNIESNMRAEGFRVSNETKLVCKEILRNGKNASELANYHVSQVFKKAR